MKIIESGESYTIVRLDKIETKMINDILSTDEFFTEKIEIINHPPNNYLLKSKSDIDIKVCLDYLKHCFVKETIQRIIKSLNKKYFNEDEY